MSTPIKTLRKKVNLSAKEVADYLGCSLKTYRKYEKGKIYPTVPVLKKLSFYYVTSIDYLLGVTDTDAPYPRIYQKEDRL